MLVAAGGTLGAQISPLPRSPATRFELAPAFDRHLQNGVSRPANPENFPEPLGPRALVQRDVESSRVCPGHIPCLIRMNARY